MSRDPEAGKIKIPASLHKYLYAGGDPVNRIDPRGRDALLEFQLVAYFVVYRVTPVVVAVEVETCTLLEFTELVLMRKLWEYRLSQ